MADETKVVQRRRKSFQWMRRLAGGAVLGGIIALAIWFGMGQPRLWRAPLAARPTAELLAEQNSLITATVSAPASPLSTPFAPLLVADNQTFTSRELVTTTLALPLESWDKGAAQSVALSADGRWIAFTAQSAQTRATENERNSVERTYDDLYLYDAKEETLTLVTAAPDGTPSNGWAGAPALVPDGRYLAFYAWASNLVAGDTNAVQDLFFYDRSKEEISRLSVGPNGVQANDRSGDSSGTARPAISADGRFVAFHSTANNLTPNDNNARVDIFLRDRETATTTLISMGADGTAANGDSSHPALSVDARYLLFQSRATNLDPTVPSLEGPGASQLYLHNRVEGTTQLISRGPDGRPGNGNSTSATLSGDGRYLVYASDASNLVPSDSNQVADIFLHDRSTGETRRVSVSSAGMQANRAASSPTITLDGRHIVFRAEASNLVNGDGNNVADLFIHDQVARHTSRVSVAVRGVWQGQEANGPTQGRAAVIPGGRLIGFVSQATNLVEADASGLPGLFLHERIDAPTFTLTGQVAESGGEPVADVVVAVGPHRTTTDAQGRFYLSDLVGGTYTLAVAKVGYTFSPPRRTVSVLRDLSAQDFLAFAGSSPDAFLDLPFSYDGAAATLLWLLRDTDEGGLIDAWFDHDIPDYSKNGNMLLWDGRPRTLQPYNDDLGCYERRCYEGHDGIDFPYRDPNPATPNIFEPLIVRPAAAGSLAALTRTCAEGDRDCNRGYGNEVLLFHDNGYFTRYSHLATVAVGDGPQWLTPELAIGEMGSTGNSFGTHLHFGVHQDNGNGLWDGDQVDRPVDPFGWAGLEPDPWVATAGGPVSRWLWRFNPTTEAILLGSQGATLRDGVGSVTVRIPAGALAGQVRVELVTGAATAPPPTARRSLGRAFRLQVLDWLQGGNAPNAAPARPVEVILGYAGATTLHLDLSQLLLYQWQAGTGWQPLPSVVETETQAVIAATNQFGDFDLQAPLLCPADALEPDDSFDAAISATNFAANLSTGLGTDLGTGATTRWERLFDVSEDEDWFQVEATAGASYQAAVDALAPGVATIVEIYDRDGLTRLNSRRGPGELSWTATEAGIYFVRVLPDAGSDIGCEAVYQLTISTQPNSR